ncbi:hypothetical protein SKAU_G00128840 [Synaphobranchus kaupii]|uniref:Peptidase C19 ubiquitin carboxyl-terminal hydrolase domain-containing protein n=1 Tax=Synaphobranchus kaupii TaxID=118154 RepID=A0A9Q1J352_SYNKA|nr:hypothetical protein SKAU_G00128840 [Synaphobranchus kaupii]
MFILYSLLFHRLEFQSCRKTQEEHISQDEIWRIDHTVLGCLAELHSARASCSRERKISLLKTLKRTISANYSDFCGNEQQDAHEFLSVLLSHLKEEGVSLRSRVCEVECQCHWCYGQLASVEQRLQSLPQVLVVQLKRFSLNSRGNLEEAARSAPHLLTAQPAGPQQGQCTKARDAQAPPDLLFTCCSLYR